jgi:hypothetical protein
MVQRENNRPRVQTLGSAPCWNGLTVERVSHPSTRDMQAELVSGDRNIT